MYRSEIANERKIMAQLWALRRRHQRASRELQTTGHTAVARILAFAVGEFGDEWEADAPRLTGTLASGTRETVFDDAGRVFIDPTITNPVFGGRPVIYGPVVHDASDPWVDELVLREGPRIFSEAGEMLFEELDGIYPKDDLTT